MVSLSTHSQSSKIFKSIVERRHGIIYAWPWGVDRGSLILEAPARVSSKSINLSPLATVVVDVLWLESITHDS